jgi:hypothetical protein
MGVPRDLNLRATYGCRKLTGTKGARLVRELLAGDGIAMRRIASQREVGDSGGNHPAVVRALPEAAPIPTEEFT